MGSLARAGARAPRRSHAGFERTAVALDSSQRRKCPQRPTSSIAAIALRPVPTCRPQTLLWAAARAGAASRSTSWRPSRPAAKVGKQPLDDEALRVVAYGVDRALPLDLPRPRLRRASPANNGPICPARRQVSHAPFPVGFRPTTSRIRGKSMRGRRDRKMTEGFPYRVQARVPVRACDGSGPCRVPSSAPPLARLPRPGRMRPPPPHAGGGGGGGKFIFRDGSRRRASSLCVSLIISWVARTTSVPGSGMPNSGRAGAFVASAGPLFFMDGQLPP